MSHSSKGAPCRAIRRVQYPVPLSSHRASELDQGGQQAHDFKLSRCEPWNLRSFRLPYSVGLPCLELQSSPQLVAYLIHIHTNTSTTSKHNHLISKLPHPFSSPHGQSTTSTRRALRGAQLPGYCPTFKAPSTLAPASVASVQCLFHSLSRRKAHRI